MSAKIKVENLSKIFGKNPKSILKSLDANLTRKEILKKTGHTVGINRVNFEVEEGETFVIMGLSGSGKSTLIRCLNLLNKPTEGKVIIDGENILEYEKKQLRDFRQNKISMVFQHFGLFNHRTVIENVEFGLEVKGSEKEARYKQAKNMLEAVGLSGWEDCKIRELSGGMQQRVGLARALANNPDILLMDEPFSALDPLIRRDMHSELLDLQSQLKKTIIFITHDINEAFKLGDRVAVLKDGVIEQIGTPEEIIENPSNDYIKNFIQDIDRTRIIKAENIMKKPKVKISINTSLKVAIKDMEEADSEYAFVVGEDRKFVGLVTIDNCLKCIEKKIKIKEIIEQELSNSRMDMYVKDLIPFALKSKYPIPVLSDDKKLLGVIPRTSILNSLV